MLRLRTLGTIDLRGESGEELRAVLAQPKRVALLTYLALTSRRGWQRRDRVMALFWPELDAEHARNSLNQALFFLRRHLGTETILARNSEEILLALELLWCDAVAFEEMVAAGRHADAVELYHGELLAGFHVPEAAAELELWIDGERQRLARQFAGAVEALAAAREQAGDYSGATIWWRRLAAHTPHDGRVALRLLRALDASGDRHGALEYARVYTLLIRQQFDAEPDTAFTDFVRRLREPSPPDRILATREPAPAHADRKEGVKQRELRRGWRRYRGGAGVAIALFVVVLLTMVYRARTGHADPSIRRIAVLPFENLTNDPSKEYLADVMTDASITELARYPELSVRSRASVLQFKGAKRSAAEITGALPVDAFLEGTLSGDGHMLQVTAQLINAHDDRHLWAERYVRDSANIVAIVSDIAAAIAREVDLRAAPVAERPRIRRALNAVSYSLYLRAQQAMLNRTPTAMEQARVYLHQAIAQDSAFALGYAGLAEAILISGIDGYMSLRDARDSAAVMASRALALDSSLAEAHTALALVDGDAAKWEDADREFRRAIELGPSDALARHWYAQLLFILGRLHEAYAQIKVGREIDPTSASLARTAGPIETALGVSRPSSQRSAEAVLRDPFHAWSRASFANRLSQEGKCAAARANIDTAQRMIPNNIRMEVSVMAVEYRCGDRGKAMRMLASMKRRPDARARGLWIASVYKTLGQTDSAFAWLDSVEWNADLRFNFRAAPVWSSSKNDSRYAQVLRRMGLN